MIISPSRPRALARAPVVLIDRGMGALGTHILSAIPAGGGDADIADVSVLLRSEGSARIAAAALVLMGCRCASGQPSESVIELIRDRSPHVSVWMCATPEERAGARVVRYAHAGAGWLFEIPWAVTDVHGRITSELPTLVGLVKKRLRAPAPAKLLWMVAERMRNRTARFVAIDCLLESFRRRRVGEIEARFGHDHKTLNALLEREHVVSVGQLLRVGRLAHALELERDGERAEVIGRRLGYGTSKGLAKVRRAAERAGLLRDGEVVIFRG